ncbi:MAG: flagellar biosynthetic protein FliR [Micavibrio aeruginosavorus]|uniref:Flagellar biosynthetic protein FliR n=1 Tax=Micavibrio aeruginosavorus TaxID=349221 RepID=A0A7T5UHQ6_9BACT|nr:MAG: flagellar biosynthetic protein FliR [Micavibrio aeruginosavorus]
MEQTLQTFITQGVFAFMITFVRIGAAATIMPGIGDSFVPQNIRLYFAVSLSFVLMPLVMPFLPNPVPSTVMLLVLIASEFIVGIFIGTVARILMSALDTAGMIISMQSGLGNAQVFNPSMATQGSLVGALLSVTGVVLIFVTNMHHLLIYGLIGSYEVFPVGQIPDTGSMAELISKAVAGSFMVGIQIAAPFIVLSMMLYIGMGVLSRLMPQVQVFMLSLPLQITLSLLTLMLSFSAAMLFWLTKFDEGMMFFFGGG